MRVPAEVRQDSVRAQSTYPGGTLLPAAFVIAEYEDGRWKPTQGATSPTPGSARRSLAWYLRVMVPWQLRLDDDQHAIYAAAADQFEDSAASDLEVAGRRFRVTRVERLIRIGPDGPEGPRVSDYDPEPPIKIQEQQQREQGIVPLDENAANPLEHDADYQRFAQLARAEEERYRQRRDSAT